MCCEVHDRPQEAEASLRTVLDLQSALVRQFPAVTSHRVWRSVIQESLANLLAERDELDRSSFAAGGRGCHVDRLPNAGRKAGVPALAFPQLRKPRGRPDSAGRARTGGGSANIKHTRPCPAKGPRRRPNPGSRESRRRREAGVEQIEVSGTVPSNKLRDQSDRSCSENACISIPNGNMTISINFHVHS